MATLAPTSWQKITFCSDAFWLALIFQITNAREEGGGAANQFDLVHFHPAKNSDSSTQIDALVQQQAERTTFTQESVWVGRPEPGREGSDLSGGGRGCQ